MHMFDSYFICTSPRSGSTLLCTHLEDCRPGHPASYFHRPELTAWALGLGLPADTARADLFEAAKATSKGNRPICGIRLQQGSLAFFCDQLALEKPDHDKDQSRITAIFGRTAFIYLNRTDKVEQAVSLVRAEQSGLWHRNADGSDLERTGTPQDPNYDAEAIKTRQESLTQMDQNWEDWFAENGISPLRVSYSALASDVIGVVQGILSELGLPTAPAQALSARTVRLADHVNADWIARFRAQTR